MDEDRVRHQVRYLGNIFFLVNESQSQTFDLLLFLETKIFYGLTFVDFFQVFWKMSESEELDFVTVKRMKSSFIGNRKFPEKSNI